MFRLLSRKKEDTRLSVEYDLNFESEMHVWEKPTKLHQNANSCIWVIRL